MALEQLAPELLGYILTSLDSPWDLYSLIKASPSCFRAFGASRQLVFSGIIQNVLLPDAIYHALALLRVPKAAPETPYPDSGEVETFLAQYLGDGPSRFRFPTDLQSISSLIRLLPQLSRFVDNYFNTAIMALGLNETYNFRPLSPVERTRLQRAFLRFEVYCRIYPVDPWETSGASQYDTQFNQFIGRLDPWEVEEMSCIHEYYSSLIGRCLADFEDHFIHTILEVPRLQVPSNWNLPLHHLLVLDKQIGSQQKPVPDAELTSSHLDSRQSDEKCPPTCEVGEDMVSFEALNLTELSLFSTDWKYRFTRGVSYMASLGMEFLDELIAQDNGQRWDLIRRNSPYFRDFLPQAVEYPGRTTSLSTTPKSVSLTEFTGDDASRPNQAWFDFNKSHMDSYITFRHIGPSRYSLRLCGYMFWDSERISQPVVNTALKAMETGERIVESFHVISREQSVEEQLRGFKIPKSEISRLIDKFGELGGPED